MRTRLGVLRLRLKETPIASSASTVSPPCSVRQVSSGYQAFTSRSDIASKPGVQIRKNSNFAPVVCWVSGTELTGPLFGAYFCRLFFGLVLSWIGNFMNKAYSAVYFKHFKRDWLKFTFSSRSKIYDAKSVDLQYARSVMNLMIETLILSFGMLIACAIPLIFRRARASSSLLFLFGTGALFGICVFDLVPDLFQMGGITGLGVALAVGIAYSLVHLWHLHQHQAEPKCDHSHHHKVHSHSLPIFFFSIVSHCFASGILLTVSQSFSEKLAGAVFLALIGHKGYECLVFVSLLLQHKLSKKGTFIAILVYCLALPAGVLTSYLLQDQMSQSIAVYVSSIAVGSLLGCLVFDFMIPSYQQIRRQAGQIAWLALGLILTRALMGFL
jgi:hypothetical protein